MNFLGHLYFSDNDVELMHANLYGDFVKGTEMDFRDKKIKMGILLHRQIDHFIDHHPAVLVLMRELYPTLPKVTGIAVDLFFDHLLAKNWEQFHPKPYNLFLQEFYTYDISEKPDYSEEFKTFCHRLKNHNWMFHYQSNYGLRKMCEGVSSRISFKNELRNAPHVFHQHEKSIQESFKVYMKDAGSHFELIRNELKLQLLGE